MEVKNDNGQPNRTATTDYHSGDSTGAFGYRTPAISAEIRCPAFSFLHLALSPLLDGIDGPQG
jgi:hypothetical protein